MTISVLMSVHDGEDPRYLAESLQSLAAQFLKATEVILVEDGPINTELLKTIDKYRKTLNIVSVPLGRKVGLGLALNEGLDHCSYELVARMDADDICMPLRFQLQLDHMARHSDVSVLGGWIAEFEVDPEKISNYRRLPTEHRKIEAFAKTRCPFNHMTVMYKKSEVERAGGYKDFPIGQDYNLWIRMLMQGARFANLPEYLVHVRCGKGSVSRRRGWRRVRYDVKNQLDFYKLGFVGPLRFLANVSLRIVGRLLPSRLLRLVYSYAWR